MDDIDKLAKELDAVLDAHNIDKEQINYQRLLWCYEDLKEGIDTLAIPFVDSAPFEIAELLKGLSSGRLKIQGGKTLRSVEVIGLLKEALSRALSEKILRRNCIIEDTESGGKLSDASIAPMMFIKFSDDCGRDIVRSVYEYAQEERYIEGEFNDNELDAIIRYGEKLNEQLKAVQSRAKSHSPLIGFFVRTMEQDLPKEWNGDTKYDLIADILFASGAMDFKGEDIKTEFDYKGKNEKARQIRRWISSYESKKKEVWDLLFYDDGILNQ